MKNLLTNYFGFSKREYNGLLALMAILLLISILPYFYANYFVKPNPVFGEEGPAIAKLILVSQKTVRSYPKFHHGPEPDETPVPTVLFKFDPNQLEVPQWRKLGLSIKQAQAIVNYKNKGGKFYKPSDLKKMYTITPKKFEQLAPYIEIEKIERDSKGYLNKQPFVKKELVIVEINGADTAQLDQIKGIGAAFARRIVSYRTKLGGFYKKEQLMEVFGLDSIKYNEIKGQVRLDISSLQKININIADFETLKNHPYLSYRQINALIQYRKQHGKYNSLDDLKKVAILTPQNIQNLAPYLTF